MKVTCDVTGVKNKSIIVRSVDLKSLTRSDAKSVLGDQILRDAEMLVEVSINGENVIVYGPELQNAIQKAQNDWNSFRYRASYRKYYDNSEEEEEKEE